MPQKSSIDKLPEKARIALKKMIDDGYNLDQMVVGLEKAFGQTISRSAAGRFSKGHRKTAKQMREFKEIATAWATELGEVPDSKQGRLLIEMLHTCIFRFMAHLSEKDADDILKSQDFYYLAKSIQALATASKLDTDQELKIRKDIASRVSRAADKAAKEAGDIAAEGGLSAARVKEIREKLLGVRNAAKS